MLLLLWYPLHPLEPYNVVTLGSPGSVPSSVTNSELRGFRLGEENMPPKRRMEDRSLRLRFFDRERLGPVDGLAQLALGTRLVPRKRCPKLHRSQPVPASGVRGLAVNKRKAPEIHPYRAPSTF